MSYRMKRFLPACLLLTMAASSWSIAATDTNAPVVATIAPAGDYTLDKPHASLIFRVNHLGFSHYTARFKHFDARLHFDPADLTRSRVTATVDARSIETDFPDPTKVDFNAKLQNPQWLDTAKFPRMTFRSTKIEQTGANIMRITGDLNLHGITHPVTLQARYNGGYAGNPFDPHARIGFSAHGSLKRSQFGMTFGLPPPGSNMGVGDDVEIIIEAEFSGPAWRPPAQK